MAKGMTVAMVVSEMAPFAKTGGLADVAGALPRALGRLGLTVHVVVPRYRSVTSKENPVFLSPGVHVHWVDHDGFFQRGGLYGDARGDYSDNLERFSFFCRAALERLRDLKIRPQILHAHDWQAALALAYLRHRFTGHPVLGRTKTVFTIHNLAYQGVFPKEQYLHLGLPWEFFSMEGLEFYGRINLLKGGLVFADFLTTVSAAYSQEIQTPAFGEGLEGVLRKRAPTLAGIVNGIDVEIWNPADDRAFKDHFDADHPRGKAKVKAQLQKEFKLPVDPKAFLIGMVTRLASQKGLDLVTLALPLLAREKGIQLVILGSGDRAIEESLTAACRSTPRLAMRLAFDDGLAHRIYAGSDAFLMPSRYEPCGLGQMIAMRYGSVPIVRATGGLRDTVTEDSRGNGFVFEPYDSGALVDAVLRGRDAFEKKERWKTLTRRGMKSDFSWDRSAREYVKLYEKVLAA